MKINDVIQPSDQMLFEAFDATNDTEFNTHDLVNIAKTRNGPWSNPMNAIEFNKHLDEMATKYGANSQ